MLNPLLYMELRGINYDKENADRLKAVDALEHTAIGDTLCKTAGVELRGPKGSLVPQRLAKYLYETAGYPAQYKKENGRKTESYTTDVEAILSLRRKLPNDPFLNGILRHRHLEGRIETLSILPDPDGRVRCGYNVVGTETGRLTCYTSPTGAGANLQTITKSLRGNYLADPGYDFFQCDLAGADGWTVAAHCARLGDPTMLEDY
jgi:DNA polymerase I-like protein with 3'-5' exonuclease and polymerase domains